MYVTNMYWTFLPQVPVDFCSHGNRDAGLWPPPPVLDVLCEWRPWHWGVWCLWYHARKLCVSGHRSLQPLHQVLQPDSKVEGGYQHPERAKEGCCSKLIELPLEMKSMTSLLWHHPLLLSPQQVFSPSPRNYGDVISAAILHGDTTTAWALYDELTEKGLSPHQETWDALFKGVRKTEEESRKEAAAAAMSQSEHKERLLEILLYMRNNQIYPQRSLASSIRTWFERYKRVVKVLRVSGETETLCKLYHFLNNECRFSELWQSLLSWCRLPKKCTLA